MNQVSSYKKLQFIFEQSVTEPFETRLESTMESIKLRLAVISLYFERFINAHSEVSNSMCTNEPIYLLWRSKFPSLSPPPISAIIM